MSMPDNFEDYTPPKGYSVERQFKDKVVAFVLRRVTDKGTVGIFDNLEDITRAARADAFEVERRALRQEIQTQTDNLPAVNPLGGGPRLDEPV